MFDTTLILWLQSRASPVLTTAMIVVSMLAYVPSSFAAAAAATFGWRLRAGTTLLLVVATTAVLTNATKWTFRSPRPADLDGRVRTLNVLVMPSLLDRPRQIELSEDRFGFPSGHVAVAAALVGGAWWMTRRRWLLAMAALGIPLTALSRLYLGRHFPADIAGGLGIGVAAIAIAWRVFGGATIARGAGATARVSANLVGAAVLVAIAALAGGPVQAIDAGRFCGVTLAIAVMARAGLVADTRGVAARVLRVFVSFAVIGLAVLWSPFGIDLDSGARLTHFASATALSAAAVLLPLLVVRVSRP